MILALAAMTAMQSPQIDVGTTWGGRQILIVGDEREGTTETHKLEISYKVVKSEDGMFRAERSSKHLGTRIGDVDLGPPPEQMSTRFRATLSPRGFLLDLDPFDEGTFDCERILQVWSAGVEMKPFSVELTTTDSRSVSNVRMEFRPIPQAKTREFLVGLRQNSGMSGSGRMRFDPTTGRLLSADMKLKSARAPGGVERTDIRLSYRDSKLKDPSS